MPAARKSFIGTIFLFCLSAILSPIAVMGAAPIVLNIRECTIPPRTETHITGYTVSEMTNLAVYFDDRKMADLAVYPPQYGFFAAFTNNIPGDFQVRVKGIDKNGFNVSSYPVVLHYPSIATARFLFPTNGAKVFFGEDVRIRVEPILDRGELVAMSIYYPDERGRYFFDESPPYELVWRPEAPGTYTFSASPWLGDYGYGESAEPVTLTILPESVAYFTRQPSGAALRAGYRFDLHVAAVSRGENRMQWLLNGVPIPGATNSSYYIESATAADAGNYTVIVDNFAGRASSAVARVEVDEATSRGGTVLFSNIGLGTDAPILTSPPATYLTAYFYAGPAIDRMRRYYPFTIATNGYFDGGVITLSNVPPGGKAFVQILAGRSFDSYMSASKILELTAGGNQPAPLTGLESFEVTTWDYYRLEARIDEMAVTNIYEGSSAQLKATAYGYFMQTGERNTNVCFQWRKNGQDIAGATNDVFRLENAQMEDAAWYSVLVTDGRLIKEAGLPIGVLHSMRLTQNGKGEIKLNSVRGSRYTVEASQDLQTWSLWESLTADADELVLPVTPPASGQVFYRAIAEP